MSQRLALWHKAILKIYTNYLWRVLSTEERKQKKNSQDTDFLFNTSYSSNGVPLAFYSMYKYLLSI